uniref:Uncharacterized protein n=1 Tax=Rhizophora mucronata TaxID=61149 RepID=A0A2P2P9D1_RHIMU
MHAWLSQQKPHSSILVAKQPSYSHFADRKAEFTLQHNRAEQIKNYRIPSR